MRAAVAGPVGYPRMCGEHIAIDNLRAGQPGSSPRVRGTREKHDHGLGHHRLIPACAGNTSSIGPPEAPGPAHPRVCGDGPPRGWWQRQLHGWHLRSLAQIPDQMGGWINAMPRAAMGAEGRAEARALCQSLLDLAARMADYARLDRVENGAAIAAQLRPQLGEWRKALQGLSDDFRTAPARLPLADRLTETLQSHLGLVQTQTRTALNRRGAGDDPAADQSLLQELSVYRGLSESLIGATRHASALDWGLLQETRF